VNIEFCCPDFSFPLLSHEKSLDLVNLLDFEGVDIGLFENRSHLQPSAVFADVQGTAANLRRELEARELEPADVFLQLALDFESCAINHPDESVRDNAREAFAETLEFAAILGARHVTILPGVLFPDAGLDASLSRSSEELTARIQSADRKGLTLGVEPHIGSLTEDPRTVLRLLDMTPGLTLTLDYTHFTKQGIADERIEPLLRYASHFHARGARPGRAQASVTDNTIDYPRVIGNLHECGYSGYIGIEYVWTEWEHMNEVDNVSESIRLRDVIREAAAHL
jgi:sugar phosphate isomerase/epimerase